MYRTNAQSRPFEERLVRDNIPYKIVGGVNFYSRRENKDLLAYLKPIDNGRDDLAVKRIINIPKRGIGATTINKVQDAADSHGISFFDALDRGDITGIKGTTQDKLHSFVNMILYLRAALEAKGVEKILDEVLDLTDYINQMDVDSEEEAEERVENIEELRNKVASYCEESENPTLSELLEEIALIADVDSLDENDDRVLLMTIHSAKGLEYKNVYLVGMEDGLFPSYMSISTGDVEVEEERRLAYVAITRAKEDLTITCARARMNHGETQYNPVSRFVREIPNSLFDIAPMTQRRRDDYDDHFESASFNRKPYSVDGFTGFKRTASGAEGGTGFKRTGSGLEEGTGFKRTGSGSFDGAGFKKAASDDTPFIAKMSDIKKGSDIMAGGSGDDYGVGDRVKHVKFGVGTVIKLEDSGNDKKVTVSFDTSGVRVMIASFARLVKV